MARPHIEELVAFIAVARERSFTRAAAQLGLSPSALSHTVRNLEAGLGVRLLMRTTRSVTTTEAGERLLGSVGPQFDGLDEDLASLNSLRDRPAGTIRIAADETALATVLWPGLRRFLPEYPDIHVEIVADAGLTDLATGRYDAGVRLGGLVAKDMISVPIGPDMRMVVVASPTYLASAPRLATPADLSAHRCINLRVPPHGGIKPWEFRRADRELNVRVEGQLTFTSVAAILQATLDGFGLAHLSFDQVRPWIESGALIQVLADWSPSFAGYHLYYPNRRQPTPAFTVMVNGLRHRR